MPGGELLRNVVVRVESGIVKEFYAFAGEVQSMFLVDDIFVSNSDCLKSLADIKEISHPCEGEKLYAYRPDSLDELVPLE